ncbi:hypothetical protein M422DRAFT_42905 [Sphaerobolus stellatus SS14]|nr:hypothetical protein M422DRAFT_42905 [Sphaerobolus stellatus SS14]
MYCMPLSEFTVDYSMPPPPPPQFLQSVSDQSKNAGLEMELHEPPTAAIPFLTQPISPPSSSSVIINITNSPGTTISADVLNRPSSYRENTSNFNSLNILEENQLSTPLLTRVTSSPPHSMQSSFPLGSNEEKIYFTAWYDLFNRYDPGRSLQDIWVEWSKGINSYLPLRTLMQVFNKPAWHRSNKDAMTEAVRRAHLGKLIECLIQKPHWNPDCALGFLSNTYGKMTPKNYCRYLAKDKGKNVEEVLEASMKYCR